jgi:phage terminase small subunit
MANHRTPLEKARITGRIAKNPGRFAMRKEPATTPLGAPSKWLTPAARAAWRMWAKEIPWLAESDRMVVEMASILRAKLMAGEDIGGVSGLKELRLLAGQLGATPADRSKIKVNDDGEAPRENDSYFH